MAKRIVPSRQENAPRKLIVLVHGAGNLAEDWYKPLVSAIEQELGQPFAYMPVYYADVASRPRVNAVASPEMSKFKEDFQRELQKSFDAARVSPTIPSDRAVGIAGLPAPIENFAIFTTEIADYFFNVSIRTEIQARLIEKLDQAKRQSNAIVIASHSLGSAVCFDVLKQSADRYRISLWFTAGSPIAKLRRIGKYEDDLGAITTQNVAGWHNIYDTTDWIADPLGPAFPKPGYRLHDIFVNVGCDPVTSHDYFDNRETIQMFADALR